MSRSWIGDHHVGVSRRQLDDLATCPRRRPFSYPAAGPGRHRHGLRDALRWRGYADLPWRAQTTGPSQPASSSGAEILPLRTLHCPVSPFAGPTSGRAKNSMESCSPVFDARVTRISWPGGGGRGATRDSMVMPAGPPKLRGRRPSVACAASGTRRRRGAGTERYVPTACAIQIDGWRGVTSTVTAAQPPACSPSVVVPRSCPSNLDVLRPRLGPVPPSALGSAGCRRGRRQDEAGNGRECRSSAG